MPEGRLRKTPLEHFTLFSEFEISKEDLLEIRRHLTNARRDVGRDFAFYPELKPDVILAKSETFHAYTSLGKGVAGLYDGKIHIPLPSNAPSPRFVQGVLWHEYTHAVVTELSRNKCPVWLSEGFAVYEESLVEPPKLESLKAALAANPNQLPLKLSEIGASIDSVRTRDATTARLAYDQAYCLVHYLFSRYSRANINEFLRLLARGTSLEESLQSVFHISPKEIEPLWLRHVQKLAG